MSPVPRHRTQSRVTRTALSMLGNLIRIGRVERRMTVKELADRAGISHTTLSRIEKGDPGTEIGLAFEAALIVGVRLFEYDERVLEIHARYLRNQITLLPPKSIRKTKQFDDGF